MAPDLCSPFSAIAAVCVIGPQVFSHLPRQVAQFDIARRVQIMGSTYLVNLLKISSCSQRWEKTRLGFLELMDVINGEHKMEMVAKMEKLNYL